MRTVKRKYHYFYKITNNLNGHYYYGIHSTDDLDDGYMGSGTRLRYAYEKYGIENFTKEILKFFETREDAAKHEADVVNEVLVKDGDCYNIILGGDNRNTTGTVTVRDTSGKCMQVSLDDPRYLSGELKSISYGYAVVCDSENNKLKIKLDDPRYLSGEYSGCTKGHTPVKDKNNKYYCVSIEDPRYLSGELKSIWFGKKHKPETIEKVKRTYKEIGHQQGEKNSQYGTCWITKEGENKKIKKEELEIFIQQGWKKGRNLKSIS